MKSKACVTLMVCTRADGNIIPLAITGKEKINWYDLDYEQLYLPLLYTNKKMHNLIEVTWYNDLRLPHHV